MKDNAIQRLTPMLISVSGIDGSGKSTQIENIRRLLPSIGRRECLLTFWDDVVVGTRYRESFVHRVYGSEQGIGTPERPVNRRDKNVRAWYLTCARHLLYFVDAVHLRIVVSRAFRSGADVVIMDRYIYDELANLPLRNPLTRAFIRLVRGIVPKPGVAFLLDAAPETARARKPEYSVDFLRTCRRSYFRLSQMLGNITIIPPLPLSEARREIERTVLRAMNTTEPAHPDAKTAPAA